MNSFVRIYHKLPILYYLEIYLRICVFSKKPLIYQKQNKTITHTPVYPEAHENSPAIISFFYFQY